MLKVLSEKSKCYSFFEMEGVGSRDLIWDYNLISHQMNTSIHPTKCTGEVQISNAAMRVMQLYHPQILNGATKKIQK